MHREFRIPKAMASIADIFKDGEMENWVNDKSNLVFMYVYPWSAAPLNLANIFGF